LFKAKISDYLWIALACWCSYFSIDFFINYLKQPFAVFLSAFILGLFSNVFAIFKNRNASTVLVPGMVLLVPGTLGFLSVSQLIEHNIVLGIDTAINMLSTAMALVFGLIFSNIILSVEHIKIKK
jgi:uncharacterized membrane protein YjjB (DUF3815 family)